MWSSNSGNTGFGRMTARGSSSGGVNDPMTHTRRPIVTGSSVLGIVYDGGVMMAADTLLSYGSMAKTMNVSRFSSIDNTLIGASGEYSDYQSIRETLEEKSLELRTGLLQQDEDSVSGMTARSMWNYLRIVMYNRRNKMNPLWNDVIVAGVDNKASDDGKKKLFLGIVDKLGTTVEDKMMATGFGAYMAMPLMRERWTPDLNEGEARALLEDCMRLLFYRDCRASNRIQLAKVTVEDGVLISEPYELETDWTPCISSVPIHTPLSLDV